MSMETTPKRFQSSHELVQFIAQRVKRHEEAGGGQHRFTCPACGENGLSLSVKETPLGVIGHCFECSPHDAGAWYRALGLAPRDLVTGGPDGGTHSLPRTMPRRLDEIAAEPAPAAVRSQIYRHILDALPKDPDHFGAELGGKRALPAEAIARLQNGGWHAANHQGGHSPKPWTIARQCAERFGLAACAGTPGFCIAARQKGSRRYLSLNLPRFAKEGACLMVASCGPHGLIDRLIIAPLRPVLRADGGAAPKYRPLTSSRDQGGQTTRNGAHHSQLLGDCPAQVARLGVCEGVLKADLLTVLTGMRFVGFSGHASLIAETFEGIAEAYPALDELCIVPDPNLARNGGVLASVEKWVAQARACLGASGRVVRIRLADWS